MRLDAPADGIIQGLELRMRAQEPAVSLGLGGELRERGNRVALQLDPALRVRDGVSLLQRRASHCIVLRSYPSVQDETPYPAAATSFAGCTKAVKSSISVRVMSPMANLYCPISETGVTSAAVPVMKHSENPASSSG